MSLPPPPHPPSDAQLVPEGPVVGAQFLRLSWRILRARASLLVPAALILGAMSAAAEQWLLIRAAGGAKAALDAKMDIASIVTSMFADGKHPGPGVAAAVIGGFLAVSLVIPSAANSMLIGVIGDAVHSRRRSAANYLSGGVAALWKVVTAQVLQASLALGPLVAVYVWLLTTGNMTTTVGRAASTALGLPLALAAAYLTIGWYLSPQEVVINARGPWAAMRASSALVRKKRIRVMAIVLATVLVCGFLAAAAATPLAWLATLNGDSAAGPTLGSRLVSDYITSWVQQSVTIIGAASVFTLLHTDLTRRLTTVSNGKAQA